MWHKVLGAVFESEMYEVADVCLTRVVELGLRRCI